MEIEFWGQKFKINLVIGCIGGFVIAIVASMFGFGGGPFMVPLMALGMGLPMYVVVGSSLLAIFFNTAMGTVQHFRFGNFDLLFFLIMFPAAILGGYHRPSDRQAGQPPVVKRIAAVGLAIWV